MAPYTQAEKEATQKAAQIAGQSTVPVPGPHARLLAMISGLATGLGAAGKAMATGGREGGIEEVTRVQGEEQQQKIAAQQAREAQKSAQIQQQLTIADTNHKLAQNVLLLATLPNEIAKSDLEVKGEVQKQAGEAQRQAITGAEFQASHGGMAPDEFSKALAGPAAGQTGPAGAFFTTNAQQILSAAKTAGLADDNPFVQKLQTTLSDPKASARDLWTATNQLQSEQERQSKALEEKSKREAAGAASPVGKLGTPEALAAPGAQAAIQAKIDDPTTDPNDVPRLRALLPQAAVAQLNAANIKAREARNTQIINQGDPDVAGKMLADRTLTLDELKSRQVTPAFIEQATAAAQKYDPNFKAPEAAAQARMAASPANQQFFGNTDSLLVKGGTLDQLAQAHAALGNTKLPFVNKIENWRKAQVGSGPVAAFAAAALGVADDGSKVMSGGTGSDTSRQQFLDIIARDLSNEGMTASLEQIRKQITSQRNGRIGTNPYNKDMFPDPSTRQETPGVAGTQPIAAGSPASKIHANMTDFTHHFSGAKGTIYSDDGRTWYDASGNLVPGK
jgi:hypothetical protein